MKLSFCKFSQSVRINGSEHLSFSEPDFEINMYSAPLEHGFIALVSVKHNRTGEICYTTVANMPYFKIKQDNVEVLSEKKEGTKSTRNRKPREAGEQSNS